MGVFSLLLRFLVAFAKLMTAFIFMSVFMEQLGSQWTDLYEI